MNNISNLLECPLHPNFIDIKLGFNFYRIFVKQGFDLIFWEQIWEQQRKNPTLIVQG